MFNSASLQKKWAPLLEAEGLDKIDDNHRRAVTAQLLENQERFLREERAYLTEAPPTTSTDPGGTGNPGFSGSAGASPVAGFDPVLISLIRRAMPNLVAYDLAGVQPMSGPTGLIFAMRSQYNSQSDGREAFFNEPDTAFSAQNVNGMNLNQGDYTGGTDGGASVGFGTTGNQEAYEDTNPSILNGGTQKEYAVGQGFRTQELEALGDNTTTNDFREMSFSIEKVTVTARSRALKAEYSLELAQDLKAIHGLDAEAELANILSTEILAEINREIVRTIYKVAETGAQTNVATSGIFDLDVDSNGRWMVEKFKGMIFQLERDANAIAQRTRRGKGNIIMCSADVASALAAAGQLDYTPALNSALNVDDTGNTFAGTLNGRYKVYIDPFAANLSADQYYVMGYKGTSPYDAGLFYCPYVPLQMVRAVGQDTFQPKIGFKTRYGMVANPFAEGTTVGAGAISASSNRYYRRVKVRNLM
tara:strand:+ start:20062 stop:21486 length:1425 start_codon:yes stop_codon:yes gene_type:complete